MAEPTIAIFGGTFDPPHVGHVLAVHFVLLTQEVERVLVIPSAQHPFGKKHRGVEHRLEMCRLAFAGLGNRVEVLDIEARREGKSYTVDTVEQLRRIYPEVQFTLVIGSDIVSELPQWKDWDRLREMIRLCVLERLDEDAGSARPGDSVRPHILPRISSTQIRAMLAEGKSPRNLVPAAVLDYIAKNEIYANPSLPA